MPESFDISVEEIVAVAQAALRGNSLKEHAAHIRQYIDEALMSFDTLDNALKVANAAQEANGLTGAVLAEDRAVVAAAEKYVLAENRMLHVLLKFAQDGGANSGGLS